MAQNFPEVEVEDGANVKPEPKAEDGKAEAETPEAEEVEVNEADSPPADEQNVDEKSDLVSRSGSEELDPKWFTDKIDKMTGRIKDAEREFDRERAEGQAEIARLNEVLASRPEPKEPLKTLEDFDHDEAKYSEYRYEVAEKRGEQAAERVAENYRHQEEARNVANEHSVREKAFAATVDDYYEKSSDSALPISFPMRDEIHKSEIGPQMVMKLAGDHELANKISNMTLPGVVRAMTLLEMDLKTEMSKGPKKVTDAPPPPPAIKAGDPGIEQGYTENMSDRAFDKMRRKEISNR